MVEIYSPNITVDTIITNHFAYYQYPSIIEITSFSIEFHRIRWGDQLSAPTGNESLGPRVGVPCTQLGDVKDETASHRAEHVKHMTRHM